MAAQKRLAPHISAPALDRLAVISAELDAYAAYRSTASGAHRLTSVDASCSATGRADRAT
jgi:hypothetical protein